MNKQQRIRQIQQNASKKAGRFARELVTAASEDKEDILAAIEFEKWLAKTCGQCL